MTVLSNPRTAIPDEVLLRLLRHGIGQKREAMSNRSPIFERPGQTHSYNSADNSVDVQSAMATDRAIHEEPAGQSDSDRRVPELTRTRHPSRRYGDWGYGGQWMWHGADATAHMASSQAVAIGNRVRVANGAVLAQR